MTDTSIQAFQSDSGALSAESYQTFELAKKNDTVLCGNDISQIRSYAAYARAQAQAIHKTIAATSGIDDVAAIKAEATETAQTFAKVGIYADQRIGEILRELPTKQGARNDITSVTTVTKVQAEKQAGISHKSAIDLQAMAANPEVVEAVIAKATEEGRIVSRKQVLDAIKQQKQAEQQRDEARQEVQDVYLQAENMELEVERLKEQLKSRPQHEVVREVESEEAKRRIRELEHLERIHDNDNLTLRKQLEETHKKLDRAKILLAEKGHEDNASWDIAALTSATNQYLRNYGGKAWAFDQFYRVDEVTQKEFVKAITALAAFAQNMYQMVSDNNKLEA